MQATIKYLIDNKEWIFGGIGILALTSLFTVFKTVFFSNKKNKSMTIKQINKDTSSGTQIGVQNNYNSKEKIDE